MRACVRACVCCVCAVPQGRCARWGRISSPDRRTSRRHDRDDGSSGAVVQSHLPGEWRWEEKKSIWWGLLRHFSRPAYMCVCRQCVRMQTYHAVRTSRVGTNEPRCSGTCLQTQKSFSHHFFLILKIDPFGENEFPAKESNPLA